MKIVERSHQGLVRLNNEDALLTDADAGWAILADGMGGLLAGEEASQKAVFEAAASLREGVEPEDTVHIAHESTLKHAQQKNYAGKMGTTLIVWCWRNAQPEFAHVGDSRLYSLRAGELTQISTDHTLAQRMVDEGTIPADQAHTAPNQHILTQAVGMPGGIEPQAGQTPSDGRLLLCSDGLSDLVSGDKLKTALALPDMEEAADTLLKAALDRGGRDNISLVIIDLDA
ncbi:MAG: protein phosphatase 2C domain-containing protein [Pseudomonadota bacterium]